MYPLCIKKAIKLERSIPYMTTLTLFGTEFEISDERKIYNDYRAIFFVEAESAEKTLHDYFKKHELANKADFDELVENGNRLIDKALATVVSHLTEKEIYEYSVDSIKRIAVEPLNKFNTAAENVYNQLNAINAKLKQAEAARQKEIDSASSSWSGGGFGIEGALKGAAEAAILNAATGAVTKALTSGDNKKAKSAHEVETYNALNGTATVNAICNALYDDIFCLVKTYVKILADEKSEKIHLITDDEILKANDIFNNIKSGIYNSKPEIEKQMWIKILSIYPYNVDYYIYLFKTHNEAFNEIKSIIEWYNMPIHKIADAFLIDKYNFESMTELEEVQEKRALLVDDLSKYGISESSLTDKADKAINNILIQRRTYNETIYDTEEDCEYAKKLDNEMSEKTNAVDKTDLTALTDLYLSIINSENADKFSEICTKNAVTLQDSIIEAIKSCNSIEVLNSCKDKFEASKNADISEPVIKQINSKIKSLNVLENINESKDKVVGAAKGLFGKAKGLFKK